MPFRCLLNGLSLSYLQWHAAAEAIVRRLFGTDCPGWRCLFIGVEQTLRLRQRTSESDPSETSSLTNFYASWAPFLARRRPRSSKAENRR
jgi:hypothetical protein